MRIQFCGADRTVTGSCHLVEVNGLRLLLDLGLYQGRRDEARAMNEFLPEALDKIDAIILSHGHLDHCGKLPVAARAGYAGPIYCTPATAEVARLVLTDAAEIQEEDAQFLNRRARRPDEPQVEPLYTPKDVPGVLRLFKRVPYGQKTDLGKGVSFTFYDAGHILGSAYVWLEWDEGSRQRTLLFTADVGRYNTPIIRDPQPIPGPADHVITESTYGDRSHGPMEGVEPQLLDAVNYCVQHGSRLIVPSFAIGRTQTILWYVQKFISEGKVPASLQLFVDSPMGVQASEIYSTFRENYDEQTNAMIGRKDLFGLARVTFASSSQQSRQINTYRGACVIVASSPTCEFGRVLHHIERSIEQPNDVILFVGWTPPHTLGRRLQDGERRVRIYDRWYDLKCQVRTIHGLSAHADGDELLRFLNPTLTAGTTAHVVHGEVDQAEGFAQRLLKAGVGNVSVPARETSVVAYGATERIARQSQRTGGGVATDND